MLFADPAQLLLVRDHSATRMLVSQSKCTCRHLPVATRLPRREYFRQILL
jgi:glucuronate isomerase